MKICLISNLYPPYVIGGAELYVERIATALSKNNDVVIITTQPFNGLRSLNASVEQRGKIKIYRFFPLNLYHMYYAKQTTLLKKPFWHSVDFWNVHSYFVVKRILSAEKPDVVHTHNLGGLSLSVFDAIKDFGLPLIHTLHDYSFLCPNAMLFRSSGAICKTPPLLCAVYRRLKKQIIDSKPDIVTAPSKFVLDAHLNSGFFLRSKMIPLSLGIELEQREIQKDHGLINVLYAGQLSKHKGVHVLIAAFKQIKNKNLALYIVGKGPDAKEFEQLAKGDNRIKFNGFLSKDELSRFYRRVNLTVVPSLCYDNSPMVIYESFANGVPVVGSKIGGIPELVEDGKNGFLFGSGDVNALKNIIEDLVENPSRLNKLSKNASESVKKYNMAKHVKMLMKYYIEAIRTSAQNDII